MTVCKNGSGAYSGEGGSRGALLPQIPMTLPPPVSLSVCWSLGWLVGPKRFNYNDGQNQETFDEINKKAREGNP